MKRYFAKPDTWFEEGTEAFLETDIPETNSGIYRGTMIIEDTPYHRAGWPDAKPGDRVIKGEVCHNDEFNIVEE